MGASFAGLGCSSTASTSCVTAEKLPGCRSSVSGDSQTRNLWSQSHQIKGSDLPLGWTILINQECIRFWFTVAITVPVWSHLEACWDEARSSVLMSTPRREVSNGSDELI